MDLYKEYKKYSFGELVDLMTNSSTEEEKEFYRVLAGLKLEHGLK